MGLNRMMMKNGEVKVEDGRKYWTWNDANNKTITFTVPPGIKRIKVTAVMADYEGEHEVDNIAYIQNLSPRKYWGEGYFQTDPRGDIVDVKDIYSIVGVTPNKTYTLFFNCYYTYGVTFSWGQAINDMKPTVEDY